MVQCKYCKTDIETETAFCPFCGKSRVTPIERRQRVKNAVRYGVQAAILILGIVNAAVLIHHANIPHTQVVNEGDEFTTTIIQNTTYPDMVHRVYYKEYIGNIVAPHYAYYAITNVSTNITVDPGERVYLIFNCRLAAGTNILSISFYIGIDGVRESIARTTCYIQSESAPICFQYWNTTLAAGEHQVDIFTYLEVGGNDPNLNDPMLWIQTYYNNTQ